MENDDFANVSWQSDEQQGRRRDMSIASHRDEDDATLGNPKVSRHGSTGPLGRNPNPLDLAGVGDAVLHCEVTNPIKENDGTKDAYVSYLVTTNVRTPCRHEGHCADSFP
jgi:sorting nexin-4